jgi:alcohol dehydrogenase class IV
MERMTPFDFHAPGHLMAGFGATARIGTALAALGLRKPLLVTDAGLVSAGLVARVEESLAADGLSVTRFDDVVADPPEAVVLAAARRAASCDCVIGLGGGSSLDVAKLAALLAGGDDALGEIYGVGLARGRRLPLVQVPTTAGTGSEATPVAIVTVGEDLKKGVSAAQLLPDIAVLDPDLLRGLPASVMAATGYDAMVHAIEAHTSISANANPLSRDLARQALRLLGANLRNAVLRPGDDATLSAMALGSHLAGRAFANAPVGAVHALAYPVGGLFGQPHGVSVALVLTETMRFNAAACAEAYATLATDIFPNLDGIDAERRCDGLIDRMEALRADIGLPGRLREIGVAETDLGTMAGQAMLQTRLLVNNPRPVAEADALAIYGAAL